MAAVRAGAPDRRLVVVTGKGGVGKSTVAAALGLAAARRGRRVIVVEVAARSDVRRALTGARPGAVYVERRLAERLDHMSIDPRHALQEYVRRQLPRPAAALLMAGGVFELLAAATPGLAELLTIGKVWELAEPDTPTHRRRHDVVVLDAPATGHGLALLSAPATLASATRTGPITSQSRRIDAFIRDPGRTAVVAVATAEEMAVAETLHLRDQLRRTLAIDLDRVVVNAVLPDRFSAAEERVLEAAPPSPGRRVALHAAARARHQRAELQHLRDELDDVPIVTLPFLFEAALGPQSLGLLSRRLEP